MEALTDIHLYCCLMMTGLIWIVQLVHYPSFRFIPPEKFRAFSHFHVTRISIIVLPLMLIELISGFWLFWQNMAFNPWGMNFALILVIWICTFFLSIPCHASLLKQHNPQKIQWLIVTNWPRTLLWSLRSLGLTLL